MGGKALGAAQHLQKELSNAAADAASSTGSFVVGWLPFSAVAGN
jgi:hypothetical protein